MIKRLKTSAGLVAGLAALSLGGGAIASAASSSTQTKASVPAKHEATGGRDTDNVQSGDQTTPDAKSKAAKEVADPTSETSSETTSESSRESAANNDGPGGYADPAGNANTQQQGQN